MSREASAGADLVLLHGFMGSSASWSDAVVDGLASTGRSPVLVDLPGHGRHAGVVAPWRFTVEAVAADILRYADHGPVDLIGYSMGGRLALDFALTYPDRVRRLVLESASPGLETDEERARRRADDEELAKRLEDEGIESFVDHWEDLPLFESQKALPPEVRAGHRAGRLRNHPLSLAAALRGLGTGSLSSHWGALSRCKSPTLLLAGALDKRYVGIGERMRARMPDAHLVVVPGVGHAVHLENPAAWVEAVAGFLA
jgi:2-succinyl-6-hydroxy-2,4-cyclohexadiene-1-carboxylate synthase